jgi:hypothetical protein
MRKISTLRDLKERLQAGFENNEESLDLFGKTYSKQLKAYLVECNHSTPDFVVGPSGDKWQTLDSEGWYLNLDDKYPNSLFLDATRDRVWIIYSIMGAELSDFVIESWIKKTRGIDRCWLSRRHLMYWGSKESWSERGIGLRFSDGLSPEDDAANLSIKAWYGATDKIQGLGEVIQEARKNFAIYSVRWQKRIHNSVAISAEWYSSGKVTINRAVDVDEVLISISEMANKYEDSLKEATILRNTTMGAFEIDFEQKIDLDSFSEMVMKGTGEMRLWLVETENQVDFRRFRGIDLHTWDRVLLDVGPNYAYLTIPGKGCVNAVPRIAVIQGEDNAGKTKIYHDGVEIFA